MITPANSPTGELKALNSRQIAIQINEQLFNSSLDPISKTFCPKNGGDKFWKRIRGVPVSAQRKPHAPGGSVKTSPPLRGRVCAQF